MQAAQQTGGRGPLQRWFTPLGDPAILRSAWYLLTGLVLGWLWFAAVLAMLTVSLVLVLIVVGVPLTLLAFGAVAGIAGIECRRAGIVGVRFDLSPPREAAGLWRRFTSSLSDPVRWRQVAYLLLSPFAVTAAFVLFVLCWSIPVSLIGITVFDGADFFSPDGIFGTAVGVFLLPLGARISIAIGRGMARLTSVSIGVDTAEAAQARVEQLTESRAEILEAVAAERRRIERNLHDGVQQRLVALGIDLGMAEQKLPDDPAAAAELLASARTQTRQAIGELRAIGRGMHPAVLGDRGLDAALSAVVASGPLPVALDCRVAPDLPVDVAETAYFVVSEAVANVMKHARARSARVVVRQHDGLLDIEVADDGVGGAMLDGSGGLAGMAARVRGADGTIWMTSPEGGPTVLGVTLPVTRNAP